MWAHELMCGLLSCRCDSLSCCHHAIALPLKQVATKGTRMSLGNCRNSRISSTIFNQSTQSSGLSVPRNSRISEQKLDSHWGWLLNRWSCSSCWYWFACWSPRHWYWSCPWSAKILSTSSSSSDASSWESRWCDRVDLPELRVKRADPEERW